MLLVVYCLLKKSSKDFPELSGFEIQQRIKSLLMSTATPHVNANGKLLLLVTKALVLWSLKKAFAKSNVIVTNLDREYSAISLRDIEWVYCFC